MACCVTCHRQVRIAVTDRGRILPLQPRKAAHSALAVAPGPGPGIALVRYLRGGQAELRPGEQYAIAHWDVSPHCKPARPRRASPQVNTYVTAV